MEYYGAIYDGDNVSQYLKAQLTTEDYAVTGYISQGAAMNITSNWETPLSMDNIGSLAGLSATANLGQVATNETSIMRWNSLQVWEGGTAPTFTLPLSFYAWVDAAVEVQGAIMALQAMISPELNDTSPRGRRPYACVLDLGRRIKITDVIIQSVDVELDAPRTREGYFLRNTVSLQLSGMSALNRSDVPNIYL